MPKKEIFFNEKTRSNTIRTICRETGGQLSVDNRLRAQTLKDKVREADQQYTRAINDISQTRKSINTNRRASQKLRIGFLKLFESKKLKLHQKNSIQHSKFIFEESFSLRKKDIKKRKLSQQLQLLSSKTERQENQKNQRLQSRAQKRYLQKQLQQVRNLEMQQNKKRYLKGKVDQSKLHDQRNTIQQINKSIARRNYATKLAKEINLIQNIDDFLKSVQEWEHGQVGSMEFSKLFLTHKIN